MFCLVYQFCRVISLNHQMMPIGVYGHVASSRSGVRTVSLLRSHHPHTCLFSSTFCAVAFPQGPHQLTPAIWTFLEVTSGSLCSHVSEWVTAQLTSSHFAFARVAWLAQGSWVMAGTACYCAANRGGNPCKPVTDSLIPVSGLLGFVVCFCLFVVFVLLLQQSQSLLSREKRKHSSSCPSLFWVQSEDEIKMCFHFY